MQETLWKCYRVWYKDGSAVLVDATSDDDAIERAERLDTDSQVDFAECLDKKG